MRFKRSIDMMRSSEAPVWGMRGVNGLSAVAEAIEIPDARDRAAGQTNVQQDTRKLAEAALANSKREGLQLAVRARWIALAVIAVTLPISNPNRDVIYYILMLGFFAAIGWAQLKVGKAGRSRPELLYQT
jgi:adenylate cyclase